MRAAALFSFLFPASTSARAAPVQDPDPVHRVIAPPGVEVESGKAIPVGIDYRNEGPAAHRFVPTERVRVQIVTPRSKLELARELHAFRQVGVG